MRINQIPDDIRKKAADLAKPLREFGQRVESDMAEDIRRALLAERGYVRPVACEACVDGLQADGETPCPCQSEDLPRQVRDLKRTINALRESLNRSDASLFKAHKELREINEAVCEAEGVSLNRPLPEIVRSLVEVSGRALEPVGWAYRDRGGQWVLCPSDTRPRPFEGREIEEVYRASPLADPVAWQHRVKGKYQGAEWGEWREGRANFTTMDYEERPLYTR